MKQGHSLFIGGGIIVIGTLLFIRNLGFSLGFDLSFSTIFSVLWPLLLVYYGINRILSLRPGIGGYIAVAFGTYFSLNGLANIHPVFSILKQGFFPLLLIALGVYYIVQPSSAKSNRRNFKKRFAKRFDDWDSSLDSRQRFRHFEDEDDMSGYNDNSTQDVSADQNTQQSSEPAETIEMRDPRKNTDAVHTKRYYSAKFHTRNIELTDEQFAEGVSTIRLDCTMGEIKLSLPRTVNIILDGDVSLGQIDFLKKSYDGLTAKPRAKYTAPNDASKTVRIQANVTLGEIKIKLIK